MSLILENLSSPDFIPLEIRVIVINFIVEEQPTQFFNVWERKFMNYNTGCPKKKMSQSYFGMSMII